MGVTVKEYLQQAFTIERTIRAVRAQIVELEAKRTFISSVVLCADKVQGGFHSEGFTKLSDKYIDLISGYIDDERRLTELKSEIRDIINGLKSPVHRLIMTKRYITLKRWEDIALDNEYSVDYLTNNLLPKIFKEVEKRLGKVG